MASHLLVDWWNDRCEWIQAKVDTAEDPHEVYHQWCQYVWQELWMYEKLGRRVEDKDLDFICQRRGFDDEQRAFLVEGLTYMGLYGEPRTRLQTLLES